MRRPCRKLGVISSSATGSRGCVRAPLRAGRQVGRWMLDWAFCTAQCVRNLPAVSCGQSNGKRRCQMLAAVHLPRQYK